MSVNTVGATTGGCPSSGVFGTNDTINFSVPNVYLEGTYIGIIRDVSINPNGSPVIIDAMGRSGVFTIAASTVSFDNTTITNGDSVFSGGGVLALSSTLTLSNSNVSGNHSDLTGGGIDSSNSTVILNDSSVMDNDSDRNGGGISSRSNNQLILNNSTVSSNTSNGGGGINSDSSSLLLNNSTVSGNSVVTTVGGTNTDVGGGIRLVGGGSATLNNSTVSGNQTYQDTGGIHIFETSAMLTNSTVSNNFVLIGPSGGIRVNGSSVSLKNNLIIGNFFDNRNSELTSVNSSSITSDGNIFGGGFNTYVGFTPSITDIIVDLGLVSLPSVLSPLANNGGPTLTHALPNGSPAIDVGDNLICAAAPINNRDQRGETRLSGESCDIGAFEVQESGQFFVVPMPNKKSLIFEL